MSKAKLVMVAGLFTAYGWAFAEPVLAATVSYNVDVNGGVGTAGTGPSATGTAGIVAVQNWYNTWNGGGQEWSKTNMTDSDGNPTTIGIAFSSAAVWSIGGSPGTDTDGTYNKSMLNGYTQANTVNGTTASVTGLDAGTSYNVYVYLSSDNGTRVGQVTDGIDETYFYGYYPAGISGSNANFIQATSTSSAGYSIDANYAVFSVSGVNSATFSSTTYASDQTTLDYGGIAGIQVQAVPEPASIALLLGGAAGLLGLRRRSR
jgi:hypothetical protein